MKKLILIINSGSTSLKYKLFEIAKNNANLCEIKKGYIENIGQKGSAKNHYEALKLALKQLSTNKKLQATSYKLQAISAVGHRVVHGGEEFIRPTLITWKNIKKLEKYNSLAPLHNPVNLMGIKAALNLIPNIPNIACFDTAFYQTIKDKAFFYPIPKKYYKKYRIRRFGFHGISHQYAVEKAQSSKLNPPAGGQNSESKMISCHLGGGCSITASIEGKAIDTSMGFTPLEGLIMMTRSGDIDPSIPLFLQKKEKISAEKVDKILNFESGIYGICGEKSWLKVIKRIKRGDKSARLAFDMFCYRIKKYIGAYYAVLGGLDVLIFTGAIGVGEAITRQKICQGLPFLRNVKILAIPTNEELMIAGEVVKKLKA
jgi:acetate kinase